MCGKPGHTKKNCPKVRKTKKINNITSSQYEYIDQSQSEDDIEYINNESNQEESSQEESYQENSEIEYRETNCFNLKKSGVSKSSIKKKSKKPKTRPHRSESSSHKKAINENQIFLESVKYVLTRYISQCPKEILTEIYTDLSKLFSKMKDSFYSYHLKNYTNKEVDKVWENIIKKYQIILELFFLACSENDMPILRSNDPPGLFLTSSNYCKKIGSPSLNYAIK